LAIPQPTKFSSSPRTGQGPNGGNQGNHQPPQPDTSGEPQTAYTAYKSKAGPSFQRSRIIDSGEDDESQHVANLACMAAQQSRTDYSIVRLNNSVSRKRHSLTPDRYNSPAPSSTGISGFSELDMHGDESRQLDFNSLAAYHATHLIAAKSNPITDSYQTRAAASDALRLRQLASTLADEDHYADHPSRRSSTQEQPADLVGTMSPALGTLALAQDDYQPSSTPASVCRTTRSCAKATASSIPSAEDSTIYPSASNDEKPPSTSKMAKLHKPAKSPASRFSPTWDQIIVAKGRTSKYLRKIRRQVNPPDESESPDEV
jgi:hypothetical protein